MPSLDDCTQNLFKKLDGIIDDIDLQDKTIKERFQKNLESLMSDDDSIFNAAVEIFHETLDELEEIEEWDLQENIGETLNEIVTERTRG